VADFEPHARPSTLRWIAAVAALFSAAAGCGTSATGIDLCKRIEEARCRRAPACGISLEPPYSTNGSGVDACIRYYDVACLHGLAVSDPGGAAVDACVMAIQNSSCNAGLPLFETDPACSWLTQIQPADDATGSTGATSDASATQDAEDGE
jgi:hypothetical protein